MESDPNGQPLPPEPESASAAAINRGEAFAFVQQLAEELSSGTIGLPSFPDVVARIRRALTDDKVGTDGLARIVAAEPALATRVLTMANSAALNLSGSRVTDLRAAIARLGANAVRSASIVFAFEQMKKSAEFKPIARELQALWHRSVLVAAMCHVASRRFTALNAEAAMLAGLLHGVGKLYILTRANRHPRLFASQATYHEIVKDWHAGVAKALLESWDMPEEIVRAVAEAEDPQRESRGGANLSDVLAVAGLLASYYKLPELLEVNVLGNQSAERMKATRADLELVIRESEDEVAELRRMLGE